MLSMTDVLDQARMAKRRIRHIQRAVLAQPGSTLVLYVGLRSSRS